MEGGFDLNNFVESLIGESIRDVIDETVPEGSIDYVDSSGNATPSKTGSANGTRDIKNATDPTDPELTERDMLTYVHSEIKYRGIAGHHIDSMNSFTSKGIAQIVKEIFTVENRIKNERDVTEEDRSIDEIRFKIEFTDVELTPPSTNKYKSGHPQILTPNMARKSGLTYSNQLYIKAKITATAYLKDGTTKQREAFIENTKTGEGERIASVPCLVGSDLCHTSNASHEVLKRIGEDPLEPRGYFIIRGGEWAVDNLENITNNTFHVYRNMHGIEIARGQFISKPGDAFENSYQTILRYKTDGSITAEITISKAEKIEMPFYLYFRALGINRDREIVDHIVYGVDNTDPVTKDLKKILDRAFEVTDPKYEAIQKSTVSIDIIKYIGVKLIENANSIAARKNENVQKYIHHNILQIFDRNLFPHIGNTPKHRIKKLRFMGHLINQLLGVTLGILEPTDRDSYRNKRIYAAGTSIAKAFKTHFNITISQKLKWSLTRDFKNASFTQVCNDLAGRIRSNLTNSSDLEALLVKSISSGNKVMQIRQNEVQNRVSSQTIYHKNDMNVKATLRTVSTPDTSASKQNERADDMRKVHETYPGYIDISHSKDSGASLGMQKQLAITASVCGASSSFLLKRILEEDPDVIPLDNIVPADISRLKLAKVMVNGDWIGCCRHSYELARKYQQLRREEKINYQTSIVWEPLVRQVSFWVDFGRLIRPLLIVYNNNDELKNTESKNNESKNSNGTFKQWINLTKKHIFDLQTGKITMEDLRKEKIIEYLSPEESESAYVAPNITALRQNCNNILQQYTHCDTSQAIFGVVTLASPMPNHSNAVRNTYYTNHRRQASCWYTLNFPERYDKNTTLQHYCEKPLVTAFSDSLTYPNGQNTIVSLILHNGYNQEDSIEVNSTSIDCGMFNASYYNYDSAKLEKDEQFGNPDYIHTMDIKKEADYEHIENGLIKAGTRVKKNYVLIAKVAKIPKPIKQILYMDRSIVYKKSDDAYIEKVDIVRNDEQIEIAKVQWREDRPLSTGDKLCLTPDHDVLTLTGWKPIADITLADKVACLDDYTKTMSFHYPTEVYRYKHNDLVYEISTECISQMVTLNHKMYVQRRGNQNFTLVKAGSIIGERVTYLKNCAGDKYPQSKLYDLIANGTEGEISIMSLQCGLSVDFTGSGPRINTNNKPVVNSFDLQKYTDTTDDRVTRYTGLVHCITVPTGIFYIRRNGLVSWTGNSSRTGNKGIVGKRTNRMDMPYCEDGLIPDIMVNSHSIPTRMAVNQIIECVLAQIAAHKGAHIDATAFMPVNIKEALRVLQEYGVEYGGHRRMYNGATGLYIDTHIFTGPTCYQRIQKFARDEQYAIRTGPTSALTRQPLDGKNNDGGLRHGEMEKDVFCAQGAMMALFQKFYDDSDGIKLPICRNCGNPAVVNETIGMYKCKICGDGADIVRVNSSWVANILNHENSAMNIKMKYKLAPLQYSRLEDE